ncbi:hypothetical protein P175DRAFT_0476589 [Aspergillus ochraceoroseus IBT 24754]|uniref:Major facilitator superfamily (MFS) profile domain-containing protein n=1 Tax=Aspergillus ochraceoroseus IBT 24754 TaxID=1392256 RepID=A0A2T5LYU7_9EURO|nr:uncharacterized protein P175DRAFT_0476589 [Aspergillus ochraceoroseus IBT 24754]PTU21457.1 hypothetical protein P175DRAFT_0476589 [Aspergillus ochraceoroseus IBT 24754]
MGDEIPTSSSSETRFTEKLDADGPVLDVPGPAAHPRDGIPDWRWKGTIAVSLLSTLICGYDVSNVANIQPRFYEAFGSIQLLPWIGLSFSLSVFAVLALSRKIMYCLDLRWIYITSLIVFMVGAAVAGAAHNISTVIVGRVIMGLGAAIVSQGNFTFMAVFATPSETPRLFGLLSAAWAVGLVIGGPIGSALASNPSTTWRWALYMNLPWTGLCAVVSFVCLPSKYIGPDIPLFHRLSRIDPLGIAFNMAVPVLFALALEFSGPIWPWGSASSITVWVLFGVVFIAWALQQYFCILTTPEQRAFPLHLLSRFDLLPLWWASGCAGAAYGVTLYYIPLFFAFTRGLDPLQQTVRILPFILVFIVVAMLVGGLLPILGRYNLIYIAGGVSMIAGAGAMAGTLTRTLSETQILGLEALIGIGLGCSFQHGIGISNVINRNPQDRVDSAVLSNMAQTGSIAIVLAVAGSIFQNVGYALLVDAIGDRGYSDDELRQALAGVTSVVWESPDPEVQIGVVDAVAEVIAREFYLVVAAGVLCLVCGLAMRWEKLDYGRRGG